MWGKYLKEHQDLYPNVCWMSTDGEPLSLQTISLCSCPSSSCGCCQRLNLCLMPSWATPLLVCHSLPLGASQHVTVNFEVSQTESFLPLWLKLQLIVAFLPFALLIFFLVKNNIGQEAEIQAVLLKPMELSFQFYLLRPLPFPHCGRVNCQPLPLRNYEASTSLVSVSQVMFKSESTSQRVEQNCLLHRMSPLPVRPP